ncbi:hypothetical protein N7563_22840, partial [Leclercia adecarboxylata ATCC 23216 = NBRC 102595]|nr:hypothetical protein [Leclercia adecarboxylata ATCC 23216 = NBRC 102595]
TRSRERWLGRWKKDFSKGKSFCFSHVDTFFHSLIFLPSMYELFQLNASGRPLRLFGSAPLQIS